MSLARVTGLLGLARRAGAVAMGTSATREALRAGRASVVLIAGDAAGPQRRKLKGLLSRSAVPAMICGDRAGLGEALGASPMSAVAVTDAGFATRILALLSEPEEQSEEIGLAVQGR